MKTKFSSRNDFPKKIPTATVNIFYFEKNKTETKQYLHNYENKLNLTIFKYLNLLRALLKLKLKLKFLDF